MENELKFKVGQFVYIPLTIGSDSLNNNSEYIQLPAKARIVSVPNKYTEDYIVYFVVPALRYKYYYNEAHLFATPEECYEECALLNSNKTSVL